ncbi:hypothetical protein LAZ67_6004079 [Cordylochernes scorpioides]|uniref:Uncharacterized protein n=1 Tax=Cordylochernes scorpioides TaxID=51811 RepID=A0ABY6KL66_9ARAC|nr:hypothetical protein LAZ67_6004079 [Cordylochernes scorpioides]
MASQGFTNTKETKDNRFCWKILNHPPYSPELSSSDYYLFGCMTFKTDEKSRATGMLQPTGQRSQNSRVGQMSELTKEGSMTRFGSVCPAPYL